MSRKAKAPARVRPACGIKSTGGGTFDKGEQDIFFLASFAHWIDKYLQSLGQGQNHILCAANELNSEATVAAFERLIAPKGVKMFLDSGIFNLSMAHARKHGVHMDKALNLLPEEVDGFRELFDTYVSLARKFEGQLWGYVELDLGGREQKIKTRTQLENLGLRPIPVFHPFNDGWDYFDFLASRYDRICVGNLVKAPPKYRAMLLYEIQRKWKQHPGLWIHALGVTPGLFSSTFRVSSCDSSTWTSPLRWGQASANLTLTQRLKLDPTPLAYQLGDTSLYPKLADTCATQYALHDLSRQEHFRQADQALAPETKAPRTRKKP